MLLYVLFIVTLHYLYYNCFHSFFKDLCRAHMATKNPGIVESIIPQPQPLSVSTRIASLSKESDQNSPSSRSSTSSWSEEPAMTNMDISTGHMVRHSFAHKKHMLILTL